MMLVFYSSSCDTQPTINPKCCRTWREYKSGRKQGSFLRGVPRYPPFLTTPNFQLLFVTNNIWNWFLSGQMLLDPSFRPLGGTRIWTPNSMYRMELKGTIAKILFIPPCPSTFLLTLRQSDQLCARSDLSSCATRKLKIQQNCKTENTQITMSRVSQKCWFR